jgi:hypothetical protein
MRLDAADRQLPEIILGLSEWVILPVLYKSEVTQNGSVEDINGVRLLDSRMFTPQITTSNNQTSLSNVIVGSSLVRL